MPSPSSFCKANPAAIPILYISLSSPTLSLSLLDQYGQTMIQRLSTLLGVAQVQLRGTQKYAVRVQLDPKAMQSLDLDVAEVSKAIDSQNSNSPMGQLTALTGWLRCRPTASLPKLRNIKTLLLRSVMAD